MPDKTKLSEFADQPMLGSSTLKFIGETTATVPTRIGWQLSGNASVKFTSSSYVTTNYGTFFAVLTNGDRNIGFNTPFNSDLVYYAVYIGLTYPTAMAASTILIQSEKYYAFENPPYPVNEYVSNFPNTPCSIYFNSAPSGGGPPYKRAQIEIPIGLSVPHTVTSVTPASGPSGAQVTVNGTNFIAPISGVIVKFGTWDMSPILGTDVNGNVITKYYVAKNLQPGVYPVTVTINGLTVGGPSYTVTASGPTNVTATKVLGYGSGGGTITNIQYSKNGGTWTTFGSSVTFLSTDSMSYRATYTKTSGIGALKVFGTIEALSNIGAGNAPTTKVVTLAPYISSVNHTVLFYVESI